jgi:2-oxo-4-hydroxy-4-carboxy-5-ureidoimidazoline decarboxylase
MDSIDKFNKLSKAEFISIFRNIFEKTEWIAERCYESKPYNNLDELVSKMMKIFENIEKERHLEILNSHPDLAVEKKLTEDSKNEQKNANLNQCSEEEFKELKELNERYKKKFGFPFIIAVKGKNRQEILVNFRKRIINTIDLELEEAKQQVKKIATFRLREIIK